MIYKEAIQELKEDRALYESDTVYAGDGTPDGDLMLAIDMAIEALKKQIPIKPLPQYITTGLEKRLVSYKCPCCGNSSLGNNEYKFNCCEECGQALDWSD